MRNLSIFAIIFALMMISIAMTFSEDAYADYRDSRDLTVVTQVNEYSNYVHFQPEWKSYPRNLIVDVSTTWDREIISGQEQESEISKHGAKERKNILQHVNGKPVVSVSYDYMDCQPQWFHYAKVGLDFFGNRFGSFIGSDNQSIHNDEYSNQLQKEKLQDGFAQFIPICTSKEFTSYDYAVSVNDNEVGFDVYFVTTKNQEWNYFHSPENFDFYSNCFAHNFQRFSGTCDNVSKNSGLLIVIPDELSRPMTKISVNLTEKH